MGRTRRKASSNHLGVGRPPRPFTCKHYWKFESPSDESEFVTGTCLKCGETQEVVSSWEEPERPDAIELGYRYGMSP